MSKAMGYRELLVSKIARLREKKAKFLDTFRVSYIRFATVGHSTDVLRGSSASYDFLNPLRKMIVSIRNPEEKQFVMQQLIEHSNFLHLFKKMPDMSEDQPTGYSEQRLCYIIFRAVTGYPYMQPRYISLTTLKDISNKRLMAVIRAGIRNYVNADQNKRDEFNRAILPDVKVGPAVLANIKQQQACN